MRYYIECHRGLWLRYVYVNNHYISWLFDKDLSSWEVMAWLHEVLCSGTLSLPYLAGMEINSC